MVEYDSAGTEYTLEDGINNVLLQNPIQGIVRQEFFDTPSEIEKYKEERGRKLLPLLKYSREDISRHLRYVNNIMDNSEKAVQSYTKDVYISYLQNINNSEYGTMLFYPSNGWKDYLLTKRNCVIFATTPVMAERYNFNRLEVYKPFSLYNIIWLNNIKEKVNDYKNTVPENKG